MLCCCCVFNSRYKIPFLFICSHHLFRCSYIYRLFDICRVYAVTGIMLFRSHISSVLLLITLIQSIVLHNATHITGTFRTGEFFKLLAKFGFQKTERHSQRDSYGYIYGNITSKEQLPVNITFAVLDKYNFLPLYGNRSLIDRDEACHRMFSTIDQFAFDKTCHPKNTLDFLRRIPCNRNQLCGDEDTPSNIIPGHQFTYVISNLNQPR